MMGDLYKKNTCLDFPKGGNEALVGALVRGIEKHPGSEGFHVSCCKCCTCLPAHSVQAAG